MMLIVAIPLTLAIVLNKIGGIHALFDALPVSHKTIRGDTLHRYLFLAFPFMLPTIAPIYVQRFLMSRDQRQSSEASFKFVWVYLFVALMSVGLGLCARVLLPHLPKADNAFVTLISTYLPTGIYGFVVAGILAVLMSSIDSVLNSASIVLVNDIIVPLKGGEMSDRTKLFLSRAGAWVIGGIGLIFASYNTSIFEMRVISKTLWLPIMLTPLYFLLFNLKISLKGLCVSTIIGVFTVILWNMHIKPATKIDGLFPGLFTNFLSVVIFYFTGGCKKVFTKEQLKHTEALNPFSEKNKDFY